MENIKQVTEQIYPIQRNMWAKAVPNWKKREAIEQILKILKQDKENSFVDTDWDINIVLKNKLTLLGTCHSMLDIIIEKIEKENLLETYLKDPMKVFWKLQEEYPDGGQIYG